ncbi:MAG TPA: GntR family transcriptional regulator [Chloroflexia bacterium]|nr:GntR family transcriptional regulator [Chloroflexia bacterium]
MAIWFDIDPKSGVPINKQIIDQVKRAVATGMLQPGEELPTVRELAAEHSLNPNTIAKAYQHLKLLGLVNSRPGVGGGTFIADGVEVAVREQEIGRFHEELRRVIRAGFSLGLSQTELDHIFQTELNDWYKTHPLPAPATIDIPASLAERMAKKEM